MRRTPHLKLRQRDHIMLKGEPLLPFPSGISVRPSRCTSAAWRCLYHASLWTVLTGELCFVPMGHKESFSCSLIILFCVIRADPPLAMLLRVLQMIFGKLWVYREIRLLIPDLQFDLWDLKHTGCLDLIYWLLLVNKMSDYPSITISQSLRWNPKIVHFEWATKKQRILSSLTLKT